MADPCGDGTVSWGSFGPKPKELRALLFALQAGLFSAQSTAAISVAAMASSS
jgi:hypothetical protein